MKIGYHLNRNKITLILIIVISIFVVDQYTKYLAYTYLQPVFSIKVLGNFFRLTYVENPGMAFGISIQNKWLFNGLSIAAAGILIFYLTHLYPGKTTFTYSIAIILGGAAGNLYDRFSVGKVIDFFDVEFFDIHIQPFTLLSFHFPGYDLTRWPVFNIADIAVSVGMMLIFLSVLNEYEWPWQKKKVNDRNNEISDSAADKYLAASEDE